MPVNPGPHPNIPLLATAAQIKAIMHTHTKELHIWREVTATDKALKQQLLSAINKMYYCTLQDRITGPPQSPQKRFSSISTKHMATYPLPTLPTMTLPSRHH